MRRVATMAALSLLCLTGRRVGAQTADSAAPPTPLKPWYQRLTFSGYLQVRYNTLKTNENLGCDQCDASIAGPDQFFIRRTGIVASGNITDRLYMKVQSETATDRAGTGTILKFRDIYADLWLDRRKTLRVRAGQMPIPIAYDIIQSSSVRLPLDGADAVNAAVPGERDLGAFVLWTPTAKRALFQMLVDSALKGTGDYGVLSIGVYNGQSTDRPEVNDNKHLLLRAAYPFRAGRRQILELGAQAYTGIYTVTTTQRTVGVGGPADFRDRRVGVTAVLYPRPFGLQGEWHWGDGPEYDPAQNAIRKQPLTGGYLTASYRITVATHSIIPFARAQYYDGGKKHERDARSYEVEEAELGAEWSPTPKFRFTASYMFSDRRYEDGERPTNAQRGDLLRLQAQATF